MSRKRYDTLVTLDDYVAPPDVAAEKAVEVVDNYASTGCLNRIPDSHPRLQSAPFTSPPRGRISLPHQRNAGIRAGCGHVITFAGCVCIPKESRLVRVLTPTSANEEQVAARSWTDNGLYSVERSDALPRCQIEVPTINLAVAVGVANRRLVRRTNRGLLDLHYTRQTFGAWRPITFLPEAHAEQDRGDLRRQLRRSVMYCSAGIRLNCKCDAQAGDVFWTEHVPVLHARHLLALRNRSYLLLPLVPLWRARKRPLPVELIVNHAAEEYGGARDLARVRARSACGSLSVSVGDLVRG